MFTEKMNAEHEDEKFVVLRVSGHTWQNSDPPPEFTGTKPREFKNYREKVRRWLCSRVLQLSYKGHMS